MPRRWTILAAGGVAAAGLLLTILLSPSIRAPGRGRPPTPGSGLPSGVRPTQGLGVAGPARQYVIETRTRRGQFVQIFGDTFQELGQGRARVGKPLCRVFLTEQRVVQIEADQGAILAPENTPRSGDLVGQVVLSLYDAPAGRPLDLSPGSADLTLRLYLHDARFDLELGEVDSDGPVHVTNPQFDFRGRGVSLTYNQLRQRIDRLEIARGDTLRIRTAAAGGGAVARSGGDPTTSPGRAAAVVYYQAGLHDGVSVKSPQVEMQGDQLTAWFGLSRGTVERQAAAAEAGSGVAPGPARPGLPPAASQGARPSVVFGQSLLVPDAQDVLVRWAGRLLLEPLAEKPADLAGPDDALLAVAGSPLRIATASQERIAAASADFLASSARVRLRGSPQSPLTIDAPRLGTLRAPLLVIDQLAGTGTIVGGGTLRGPQTQAPPAAAGTVMTGAELPPGLTLAWAERLDLTFYPRAAAEVRRQSLQRIRALRTATFRGAVEAHHPDVDLKADALEVGLQAPDRGRQLVERIAAAGRVDVQTRATANEPATGIRSDHLSVELGPGADKRLEPRKLVAEGHVQSVTGGRALKAGRLEAMLEPATGPAAAPADKPRLRIARLTATQDVQADLDSPRATLSGHRLDADAAGDMVELTGAADAPAQLKQAGGTLAARRILIAPTRQTIEVPGPGGFLFVQHPEARPDAAGSVMTVRWQKSMALDNKAGQARFLERVLLDSKSTRDSGRLECDELLLSFASLDPAAGAAPLTPGAAAGPARERAAEQFRRIKAAAAVGHVTFQASSWADRPEGQLATAMTIAGPNLIFESATQRATVAGPGTMAVEDRRPKAPPGAGDAATGKGPPVDVGVRFAGGRGRTDFAWKTALTFDAGAGQMTMADAVRMVHQPEGSQDRVQMDCAKLDADLESGGSIDAWMSGQAATPKLKNVTATGPVEVKAGQRTIRTDRLVFDEVAQTVLLQAAPGRLTEILEPGQQPVAAEAFKWDLSRNRLEIMRVGGGRLPIR